MGEAWFMGEQRRMFTELLGNLDEISTFDLQKPLEEIANGLTCFGRFEEWIAWYHYLLAALMPRAHEAFVDSLVEYFVTCFIAAHRDGISNEPYPGFREDALLTLGRCMMDPSCWDGSDIAVGSVLHRSNNNPNRIWMWWDASGDFSSSMFFCLKYLPDHLVESWLRSVLAIPSPHWRAQLIVWMVGAHDMLASRIEWVSQLPEEAYPSVAWAWSHCLRPEQLAADGTETVPAGPLIPDSNRQRALTLLCSFFDEETYLEWLTSISTVPYLEAELGCIPRTFEELFAPATNH